MNGNFISFQDDAGNTVNGTPVEIEESIERFSEVKLSDGWVLRIKHTPIEVLRLTSVDEMGKPTYMVKGNTVIVVTKPSN